jgi:hypothetical protein
VWLLLVVPEVLLLLPLAFSQPRRRLEQIGQRRAVALGLFGVMNGLALVALIVSLLEGDETSGAALLFKGGTIGATSVIAFGLWFWSFDRGAPSAGAGPSWHPRLVDYVYVVFHELGRLQPDGRDAAHTLGEAPHADRVCGLGGHDPVGRRQGREHPPLTIGDAGRD